MTPRPTVGRTVEQFGTGYLRLDLDLEAGMVVTIEPGFYIVPAILHDPTLRERFSNAVDFAAAEQWVGLEASASKTTSRPPTMGPT